jgi:iron complex transport system permease protein
MRVALRAGVWSAGLLLALFAAVVFSAQIGPASLDTWTVARAAVNTISYPSGVGVEWVRAGVAGYGTTVPVPDLTYSQAFDLSVGRTEEIIVQEIRLPRIVMGALVGFALGTAGTVMQGFFKNPMADPSIIGVSSGAALGAVATIAFPVVMPFGLQLSAFIGAILAAFTVYLIATQNGRTPVATLLLAGLAVQAFLGSLISYLLLHTGEDLEQAVRWLMGHLQYNSWAEVEVTFYSTVVLFVLLLAYARDLNVMLLGEEDAQTLGIEVERTKRLLLAGASVITAAAVAVAGIIGFVGLIIPHMMRMVVGPDHRVLLPTSALAGATFLVLADTFARAGPAQVPVGIVTAAVGAPFFLFLLRKREVHAL